MNIRRYCYRFSLRFHCILCMYLTFEVYTFSLVCHNAEQFCHTGLTFSTESNGLTYSDKPGGFVKCPRGVAVARGVLVLCH